MISPVGDLGADQSIRRTEIEEEIIELSVNILQMSIYECVKVNVKLRRSISYGHEQVEECSCRY